MQSRWLVGFHTRKCHSHPRTLSSVIKGVLAVNCLLCMSVTDFNLSKGIFIYFIVKENFVMNVVNKINKTKKITWYSAASSRSTIPAAGFPATIEVGDLAFTANLNLKKHICLKCNKIKIQYVKCCTSYVSGD